MRWDRVFDEFEQQSRDVAAEERDALAADLVAETLRRTSWLEFLTETVEFELLGGHTLGGEVIDVAELIELHVRGRTMWVVPQMVTSAVASGKRIVPRASVLTWRSQLGAAFGASVRVHVASGSNLEGVLSSVGGDYLAVAVGTSRSEIIVPRTAVVAVMLMEARW